MFMICKIGDENQLDAMPVVKTIFYPWTEGSYRPLCYGRIAYIDGKGLLCDLQAFDRDPDLSDSVVLLNNSCVALTIQPLHPDAAALTVVLNADGRYGAFRGGQAIPLDLQVGCYAGDDEQGWYWGVRFYFSKKILKTELSVDKMENGHRIKGNIYKFKRAGGDAHMASAAPMREDSIFSAQNLSDFVVVDY